MKLTHNFKLFASKKNVNEIWTVISSKKCP